MAWFFSRRPQRQKHRAGRPFPGPHRSPGLALLLELLAPRPARAILDLGPSSNQNLTFLGQHCKSLVVQDSFHSSAKGGHRSELFRFAAAEAVSLPPLPTEGGQQFDVVLLWDLLHYLPVAERKPFVERLECHLAKDALVFLLASSVAPVPPSPIQFETLGADRLEYVFDDEHMLDGHGLTTREVEKTMTDFQPIRLFQLRNGYQEVVLQWKGEPMPGLEAPAELEPAPEAEGGAGDDASSIEDSARVGRENGPPSSEVPATSASPLETLGVPASLEAESLEAESPEAESPEAESPATDFAATDFADTDHADTDSSPAARGGSDLADPDLAEAEPRPEAPDSDPGEPEAHSEPSSDGSEWASPVETETVADGLESAEPGFQVKRTDSGRQLIVFADESFESAPAAEDPAASPPQAGPATDTSTKAETATDSSKEAASKEAASKEAGSTKAGSTKAGAAGETSEGDSQPSDPENKPGKSRNRRKKRRRRR